MAQTAYRDGAAHDLEELEVEQARLAEEDALTDGGSAELTGELATLRLRVRSPIKSAVDVRERRETLRAYDAAIAAAKVLVSHRRRRFRVRAVLAFAGASLVIFSATSIALGRRNVSVRRVEPSCVMSAGCYESGRCADTLTTLIGVTTAADDNGCVARTSRHCERSCWANGRCKLADGECVVGSDADCRQNDPCEWEGRCARLGNQCVSTNP